MHLPTHCLGMGGGWFLLVVGAVSAIVSSSSSHGALAWTVVRPLEHALAFGIPPTPDNTNHKIRQQQRQQRNNGYSVVVQSSRQSLDGPVARDDDDDEDCRALADSGDTVEDRSSIVRPNTNRNTARRRFLQSSLASSLALVLPSMSLAVGLAQFPQTSPFSNAYHFMRIGTTLLEEEDIWSTNALFLTNREDALSPTGQEQVVSACRLLKEPQQCPTVVRHSLAAGSIDTATLLSRELGLGRDRVVGEYTFLDPRAIGQWDMLSKTSTMPAVWAMDEMEAGANGKGGRPPPNEDGTPHETLADQTIRLRQLFSLLETQYSGDTILLVFSDGTGPAVLSAMVAGIPLNRVHELEFEPGEVRLDITKDSVQALWQAKQADRTAMAAYRDTLQQGRVELTQLRSTQAFVNRKDEKLEAELVAIDEQYNLEQERKQQAEIERKQQVEATRQQERQERQRRHEQTDSSSLWISDEGGTAILPTVVAAGASFVAVVGAAQLGTGGDDDDNNHDTTTARTADSAVEPGGNTTATITVQTSKGDELPLQSYFGSRKGSTNTTIATNTTTDSAVKPQLVNGDPSGTMKILYDDDLVPPLDPYQKAEKAMKEYLDQDDGGDACKLNCLCVFNLLFIVGRGHKLSDHTFVFFPLCRDFVALGND